MFDSVLYVCTQMTVTEIILQCLVIKFIFDKNNNDTNTCPLTKKPCCFWRRQYPYNSHTFALQNMLADNFADNFSS